MSPSEVMAAAFHDELEKMASLRAKLLSAPVRVGAGAGALGGLFSAATADSLDDLPKRALIGLLAGAAVGAGGGYAAKGIADKLVATSGRAAREAGAEYTKAVEQATDVLAKRLAAELKVNSEALGRGLGKGLAQSSRAAGEGFGEGVKSGLLPRLFRRFRRDA